MFYHVNQTTDNGEGPNFNGNGTGLSDLKLDEYASGVLERKELENLDTLLPTERRVVPV